MVLTPTDFRVTNLSILENAPIKVLKLSAIETKIPENCLYRDIKEQKVTIPLLTVTKEYSFQEAQRWALEQIKKNK